MGNRLDEPSEISENILTKIRTEFTPDEIRLIYTDPALRNPPFDIEAMRGIKDTSFVELAIRWERFSGDITKTRWNTEGMPGEMKQPLPPEDEDDNAIGREVEGEQSGPHASALTGGGSHCAK